MVNGELLPGTKAGLIAFDCTARSNLFERISDSMAILFNALDKSCAMRTWSYLECVFAGVPDS